MVCFVILHYLITDETIKCVESLNKIDGEKKIIIVDNGSSNGSGIRLKHIYQKNHGVDVILNAENIGFARGNNVGCKYAEKYDPDFYIVMNNDVEIIQSDFIGRIYSSYSEEKFDVLSPDIYSTSGHVHQSPKSLRRTSIEDAKKLQKSYKKKMDSKVIVPLKSFVKKVRFIERIYKAFQQKNNGIDYSKKYYNIPIHGSCFVFSRNFIKNRKNAFFDKTFFYFESEILDYECQLSHMHVIYNPELKVLHHQNVSTNESFNNMLSKVRFMNEQNYKSISEFIEAYGNG